VRSMVGAGTAVEMLDLVFPEMFPHELNKMRHKVTMLKSNVGK